MPNLFRHHHSLLEPLFRIMFASRGISHANTITSFKCLLSKTPSLRKETRVCFWNKTAYRWNVPMRALRKPRDWLVPSAFANCGYRIKLQADVFFRNCHSGLVPESPFLTSIRASLIPGRSRFPALHSEWTSHSACKTHWYLCLYHFYLNIHHHQRHNFHILSHQDRTNMQHHLFV